MTTTPKKRILAWKSWLLNATLSALVLLISLGVGEAVLRAFVRLPMKRVLPEVRYASHPVRRFTLLPDQKAYSYGAPARIDHRAFRVTGDQPPKGNTGGRRADILALGDSFTFGMGVRDEEAWPAQLQKRLSEAAGRHVDVVNAGTISYGVFQELDLLRSSGLATRPRILVHGLYWNDFMNASAPKPDAAPVVDANGYFTWDQLSQPRGPLRQITSSAISSSALLFTLRQAASVGRGGVPPSSYAAAYARFLQEGLSSTDWQPIEDFYGELNRLATEHDFRVMVVIMPVSDVVIHQQSARNHPYPTAARALLRRLDIPYVDMFEMLGDRRDADQHFLPEPADAHLNAAGYRLVADALAKKF